MAKPKYRFGKNTVVRAAKVIAFAADGTATKPDAGTFKVLCLHQEVTIGLENGKVDLENFCTGGRTVSVRDGTKTGSMDLGNTTWVEDDDVLQMMEDAAFTEVEGDSLIWVEVAPLGLGVGKPVYDLVIDVDSWELSNPSKGVITVAHELSVTEGPMRGVQAAA